MRYIIFLWVIIVCNCNYGFSVFGMELDPEKDSFFLREFTSRLSSAIEENDTRSVKSFQEEFDRLGGMNWEKEADVLGSLSWGMDSDYKRIVGAHLFWDTAINPPHQNLLRQNLDPLRTADSHEWERAFHACRGSISEALQNHAYLRLPSRCYAVAISAHYGNPIARLFTLEFLQLLKKPNTREVRALNEMLRSICFNLRDIPSMRLSLRTFLSLDTRDFRDLSEDQFDDVEALERKSALGLPRYTELLGNYYFRLYHKTHKTPDSQTQTNLEKAIKYHTKSLKEGDPMGALSLCSFRASRGESDIAEYYEAQREVFLRGYFKNYKSLSPEDRDLLSSFLDKLYRSIRKFVE
ncbi:MAG TPA: hypothetical protein PLY23_00300 [Alphaproteobacteria bacterium]|nr:hypothetical protein [Alphaproteobacteria bacterium]HQS94681.1 hypothetical protein [Alphaproteobacteria bacterium]